MKRVSIALCVALLTAAIFSAQAGGPNGHSGPGGILGSGGSVGPVDTNVTLSVSLTQSVVLDHSVTNLTTNSVWTIIQTANSPSVSGTHGESGGSGYAEGDTISMSTDPGSPQAQFQVATVDGSGTILTLTIVSGGTYATIPSDPWGYPIDTTSGSGTGAYLVIDPSGDGSGWQQNVISVTTNVTEFYNTNYVFSTTYNGTTSNVVISVDPTMPWSQGWPASINVSNSIFTVTPTP